MAKKIVSKNAEERKVLAPVLIPNEPDSDGDIVTPEKIQQVHDIFNLNYRNIDVQHSLQNIGEIYTSYLLEQETTYDMTGETYPAGTWMMGVHVTNDQAWDLVKKGVLTGFSIMAVNPVIQENATKAEGDEQRTTLADLGTDWIVNAVSIVDQPAVQRSKWVAIKTAANKILDLFSLKSEAEKANDTTNTQEVTLPVTQEELTALIQQVCQQMIDAAMVKEDQEEQLEEQQEAAEEQTEMDPNAQPVAGKAEDIDAEKACNTKPKKAADATQADAVPDQNADNAQDQSELEQLKAQMDKMQQMMDALCAPATKSVGSKRIIGQDQVGEVQEEVKKSDEQRDSFGRVIKKR